MNEWISVKERLPEHYGLYLCCGCTIEWGSDMESPDNIFTAHFTPKDHCYIRDHSWHERTGDYEDVTITHWMPLPKLPK